MMNLILPKYEDRFRRDEDDEFKIDTFNDPV
jgi:hypothetical protein